MSITGKLPEFLLVRTPETGGVSITGKLPEFLLVRTPETGGVSITGTLLEELTASGGVTFCIFCGGVSSCVCAYVCVRVTESERSVTPINDAPRR